MNKTCGPKPCESCPWRKKSAPGWLGAAAPERFALVILADSRLPCHKTLNYEDPAWRQRWIMGETGQLCAGALVMMANILKSPRDPQVPKMEPDPSVFETLDDFIAHHRSTSARSWPDSEDDAAIAAWDRMGDGPFLAAVILAELDAETSAGKSESESEYLETVRNPGKDDGKCALCETPGLDEDHRCYGCGYLVCGDCDKAEPEGQHLVVDHDEESDW